MNAQNLPPIRSSLVDKADSRDISVVGVSPVGFGLRFHAGDAVENHDRAVKHAQRSFDFSRKINVARSVDDIETSISLKYLLSAYRSGSKNR